MQHTAMPASEKRMSELCMRRSRWHTELPNSERETFLCLCHDKQELDIDLEVDDPRAFLQFPQSFEVKLRSRRVRIHDECCTSDKRHGVTRHAQRSIKRTFRTQLTSVN